MKKMYFNPEAMITFIAEDDVITTSPLSTSTNLLGDDDGAGIGDMFKG